MATTANNPSDQKDSEKKPMAVKKKPADEIDAIFQGAKGKKKRKEPSGEEGGANKDGKTVEGSETKNNKKGKEGSNGEKVKTRRNKKHKGGVAVDEGPVGRARRRRTADGLAVYSAEELGFGRKDAGGTPLCPFDCSCCF